MRYRLEFELQGLPKTTNGPHGSWRAAANERKKWRNLVIIATSGKRPRSPLAKAKITLTRFSSACPDQDNLTISFKSVVDGLKDAGVIVDDKMTNVIREHRWELSKPRQGKIRVMVEELEGGKNADSGRQSDLSQKRKP